MRPYITGANGSLNDYRVDRCDQDVSRPHMLSSPHRLVRRSSLSYSIVLRAHHSRLYSTLGLENFRKTNPPASNDSLVFRAPIRPDRMGVAVHTSFGQYLASSSDQSVSLVHMDGQLRDKPHELAVQQDMERGV